MRRRGRSGGVGAGARLATAAAERLDVLARQWRPVPAPMPRPVRPDDADVPAPDPSPWQSVLPSSSEEAQATRRIALGPWPAAAVRGLTVVVAAAVAVSGWWWWSGRPMDAAVAVAPTVIATGVALPGAGARASNSPPAAADASLPTTSTLTPSSEVVVHVAGLVRRPGLVRLPSGSRVADAVAAAGGVTRTRAADSVNLARVLVDGEQIVVGSGVAASGTGTAPATAGPTDLNTADATALELLPGIGPVLAGRIIAWRTANGPFRSIDELGEVSGIGDAILALLRPVVRV